MAGPERVRAAGRLSAGASAEALPEPVPGSTRYFVLLYCERPRRRALATLLAVADEIDAGRARGMDHALAHVRLDWWREELQRFERGSPQHPWLSAWLRERPQDRSLELSSLSEAAAIDLAGSRLAGRSEHRLACALFVLAARLLAAGSAALDAPPGQLEPQLQALGRYLAALEHEGGSAPAPALDPLLQPRLTPLLVWIALAERAAARRPRGRAGFDMLADNLTAWRAARRARRGRFAPSRVRAGEAE